jgi:hypothetical protein
MSKIKKQLLKPEDDFFKCSLCHTTHKKICVVCDCNEANDSMEVWVIQNVGVSLICPNCKEEVYRFYFSEERGN